MASKVSLTTNYLPSCKEDIVYMSMQRRANVNCPASQC